jgi:hypothetical protein
MSNNNNTNNWTSGFESPPSLHTPQWIPRRLTRRPTRAAHRESTTPTTRSAWHNPLLPALWAGDVTVALVVTAAVAPSLTIVDKAIVQQSAAAGQRNILLSSMQTSTLAILREPVAFFRSPTFGWMWMTYGATYMTANLLKTWNEQQHLTAASSTTTKSSVSASRGASYLVAGTTVVNSGASLLKDRAYARMFGQSTPRPVPVASYAAWMLRDGLVISSSFVLPAYVTPFVQEVTGWSYARATVAAQIITPVAAQVVAGPLHLWGLTLYNHPAASWLQQARHWQSSLVSITLARMLRILPGYGLAGVANQKGRAAWKEHLLRRQISQRRGEPATLVALYHPVSLFL